MARVGLLGTRNTWSLTSPPYAEAETQILLIEPRVVNTGDSGGELTAGADLDQEVAQAEAKDVRMCLERP